MHAPYCGSDILVAPSVLRTWMIVVSWALYRIILLSGLRQLCVLLYKLTDNRCIMGPPLMVFMKSVWVRTWHPRRRNSPDFCRILGVAQSGRRLLFSSWNFKKLIFRLYGRILMQWALPPNQRQDGKRGKREDEEIDKDFLLGVLKKLFFELYSSTVPVIFLLIHRTRSLNWAKHIQGVPLGTSS